VRLIRVLPGLTRRICRSDLGLRRLVPTSGRGLGEFFAARPTSLTGHAFPAMVLWGDLFHLYWKVEADCLLVFAESDGIAFLMAPPLGRGDMPRALESARATMAALSGSRAGARAQEVDEELLAVFTAAGWQAGHRAVEYLCETESLATLRGRHYDGRRADCRRFEKAHAATWRPYEASDFPQAVALLRRWHAERSARRAEDAFYRDQLDAARFLHLRTLREAERLGLRGYVVTVGGELVAYTFGFPLADGRTMADFIEVADLGYPGLPAWVFRQFCREARGYPLVNIGTDSELPSLAETKRLYRPVREVGAWVVNAPERGSTDFTDCTD
jgi:hypothetical protein